MTVMRIKDRNTGARTRATQSDLLVSAARVRRCRQRIRNERKTTVNDRGGRVIRDDATFLPRQILVWETPGILRRRAATASPPDAAIVLPLLSAAKAYTPYT